MIYYKALGNICFTFYINWLKQAEFSDTLAYKEVKQELDVSDVL